MLFADLFDLQPSSETPIACDLSVLDRPEGHAGTFQALFDEREEIREVPGGLAIRFPRTTEYAERVVNFVGRERQCCPFLTFGIAVEPEARGTWLYMGGDEEVEEYIRTAFAHHWQA